MEMIPSMNDSSVKLNCMLLDMSTN